MTVHPCVNDGRLWVAHPDSKRAHNNNMEAEQGCSLQPVSSQSAAGQQPVSSHQFSTECADVPEVSKEKRNDDLSSRASSEAPQQCKPEFSSDKMIGDNKILTARPGGAEQSQFQPSVRSAMIAESFKVRDFLVMMKDRARSACVIATRRVAAHRLMLIPLQPILTVNTECAAVQVGDVNHEDEFLVQLTGGGRREMSSAS